VGENLYLGLMSGTSMDGIDAALMRLEGTTKELLASHNHPLPVDLQRELRAIAFPGDNEIERLGALDALLADQFAAAATQLLGQAGISADRVAAIGCHGQTIRHRPDEPLPFTLQIGDPNRIAEAAGITTVADFRRRDMAAGGQGAPLVPAFHEALFRTPDESRVVLNIGGIANITILPADPGMAVTGFDTGPGNTLMDAWARKHLGQSFDRSGNWAAAGKINPVWLHRLRADPFFAKPPPKSTGPEYFNLQWVDSLCAHLPPPPEKDLQATLTALTAETVCQAVAEQAPQCGRLIVCGGGVHNNELMRQLEKGLPGIVVESAAAYDIDPDYVEAAAFAWLAKQALERQPGNLPAVTGATRPVILGGIYPAPMNTES
jgi:anhydro-N-acetylmuramic acid kinase